MDQCPSCNRVWVPDATLPDGGTWKEESEQIEGANRDYCSDCLAKRQAEVASLSQGIEEVVEERQAEPAAPVVFEEAAPDAWRRPVIIAAAVVLLIGGAIAGRMAFQPVTEEISKTEEEALRQQRLARPSVGGTWQAGKPAPEPTRPPARPVTRQRDRQVPTGQIDPEVLRILQDASVAEPTRTTGASGSSRNTTARSTATGSPRPSDENQNSNTESSTSTPTGTGSTNTETTPEVAEQPEEGEQEQPVEGEGPEIIILPDEIPPADDEIPFIPPPDDIGIPFPPPE